MGRFRFVLNAQTGTTEQVPFTPEEEAQRDAEEAAFLAAEAAAAAEARAKRTVSPYQARVALLNAGLLPQVEALMIAEGTPQAAKIAWEYATVMQRNSAFITTLGPALGLTSEQIDALFDAAELVE